MAPCGCCSIYEDYISLTNTITSAFEEIEIELSKEKIKIPKVKEQIKRKPIMSMNTNIQNKRVYRCQNRM